MPGAAVSLHRYKHPSFCCFFVEWCTGIAQTPFIKVSIFIFICHQLPVHNHSHHIHHVIRHRTRYSNDLKQAAPDNELIGRHLGYIQKTWMDSTVWPPSTWSVYNRELHGNGDGGNTAVVNGCTLKSV